MDFPQTPAPHEHASMSLKVLLLVFALALVGALTYLVVSQNRSTTDDTSTTVNVKKTATVVTTATTIPTTTATADPTADWKTYTNTGLKFSLKYPKDYTITDNLQKSGDGTTAAQKLVIENTTLAGKPSLTIYVNPAAFGDSPTTLLYSFEVGTDGTLTTTSKDAQTIASDAPGYQTTKTIAGTNLGGIKIKGKTYSIRFSYDKGKDTLLPTFDQIIKTFLAS